jgi:phosphoglycolate phosphatase-like HAD superfamily hydrolase
VRECLQRLTESADAIVVSQTPTEALEREWEEHGINGYVRLIAGQELGSKTDHIKLASSGKYEPRHVLMIGDAPGDFKAAKSNHALFFPIVPGHEEASWQRFFDEGLDRFLNLQFAGEYEEALIREFNVSLPERPAWQH